MSTLSYLPRKATASKIENQMMWLVDFCCVMECESAKDSTTALERYIVSNPPTVQNTT